ncbi:hypothetical protein G5V57_01665 [Nordella sp. HKS 07]|uniref:hypothetical protein n=1 Tax=Nordella sp. HKS 07 TaxID=2712222 RepID=UPI0013E12CA3|nr:hypothetical protein [Nordella sp. HKS 07]QIG46576.1 hypothetical protein G5V57_01665 [Nordella sp. HKS 07]
MSGLSSTEIRQLVREALRELLPAVRSSPATGGGGSLLSRLRSALVEPKPAPVEIRIETAGDLNTFARDLLQAQEDVRTGVLSGKIQFGLASRAGGTASVAASATPRSPHQISKGVVTEIMVTEIGKSHDRLLIGKGVVVTPLARDRAREVKLEIVRDRS